MVIKPLRAPAVVGVKVTLNEQFDPGAMLAAAEQVLLAMLKSAPLIVVAPKTSATVPVLVSVVVCTEADVPTVVKANVSAVVDSDAVGDPTTTATPVPESATVLLAGEAL